MFSCEQHDGLQVEAMHDQGRGLDLLSNLPVTGEDDPGVHLPKATRKGKRTLMLKPMLSVQSTFPEKKRSRTTSSSSDSLMSPGDCCEPSTAEQSPNQLSRESHIKFFSRVVCAWSFECFFACCLCAVIWMQIGDERHTTAACDRSLRRTPLKQRKQGLLNDV